ncbi:MAG: WecB/TagA/CpsF family glycosyltransferase, partial [Pseudomonadota bacterium]
MPLKMHPLERNTNRWQRLGIQHDPLHQPMRTSVLGFELATATRAEIAYWIAERAQGWLPTRLAFLNAHCANIARKDWQYDAALKSADAILPDGSGVELAARLDGKQLGENLNGTDLFPVLCRCLAFRKIPVFLLGGADGVADAAGKEAQRIAPNLKVAGTHHGFFAPQDEDAVIELINQSGARVVMVAFGVPQQDVFLARIAPRLNAPVTIGVGGLFDFMSGRIPRAPLWLRKRGMEWLYRLRQEPRRMWRRYILGNAIFVWHAASFAVGKHVSRLIGQADRFAKRAVDIVGAGGGLAVLGPSVLVVAAWIRL